MVKGQLLEEETKRMTKRSIMKPKVNTNTVTAFSLHSNDQWSNWKKNEDGSPFLYI
jgi:hypothetical protein